MQIRINHPLALDIHAFLSTTTDYVLSAHGWGTSESSWRVGVGTG